MKCGTQLYPSHTKATSETNYNLPTYIYKYI